MNFSESQRWVDRFGTRGMDFNLDRFRRVLDLFDRPQDAVPAVHIAGTNGKGSVGSMIESAFLANGVPAAFYSSPHLVSIRERFRFSGRYIQENEFAETASFIRKELPARFVRKITHFEILTVIAFLWFRKKKAPIAVFETGLGGRLDATNVLGDARVSVITSIAMDHQAWLGPTLKDIASEKAGIFKKGVPAVVAKDAKVYSVFARKARESGTPIFPVSQHPSEWMPGLSPLFLTGAHQKFNAQVAWEALRVLTVTWGPLSLTKCREGVTRARWPGRFEKISERAGGVYLDGAHNPAAARALSTAWKEAGLKKPNVIFSSLKDKDVKGMVRFFGPLAKKAAVVPLNHERARTWGEKSELKPWRGKGFFSPDWRKALENFSHEKNPVLITGSLVFAGEVKKGLGMDPTKKLKYHGAIQKKGVSESHAASRN